MDEATSASTTSAPRDLATWLRVQRAIRDEHRYVSAEALRVHDQTWKKWESGEETPKKVSQIRALAAWSGAPPEEVFALVLASELARESAA